jgi:ribosomal-protein-alanine N-acetyltransferase
VLSDAKATVKAPERIETSRLILRRPRVDDADAIFTRYASDKEVLRFVGWPRHERIEATRAFLEFSDAEWARSPAGPYLVELHERGRLIGGTGLSFETPWRAATGYVFAKDAWGHGYATETLQAIVGIARAVALVRLYALCHVEHRPSSHVLEKCGFEREGVLRRYAPFPNLTGPEPHDVACYSLILR